MKREKKNQDIHTAFSLVDFNWISSRVVIFFFCFALYGCNCDCIDWSVVKCSNLFFFMCIESRHLNSTRKSPEKCICILIICMTGMTMMTRNVMVCVCLCVFESAMVICTVWESITRKFTVLHENQENNWIQIEKQVPMVDKQEEEERPNMNDDINRMIMTNGVGFPPIDYITTFCISSGG